MGEFLKLSAADGHEFDAYLAPAEGPVRGRLVVVQEIFGVNDHIRDVCDGFAKDGYSSLAPALFDRIERGIELDYSDDSVAQGRALRAKIPWPEVAADIYDRGVLMTGGGALLEGIDQFVRDFVNLSVIIPDEPRYATVRGLVKMFDEPELLERVSRNELNILQNAEVPFEA